MIFRLYTIENQDDIYKVKVDEKINLDFLTDGVYILSLKSLNGIESHRVVKQ